MPTTAPPAPTPRRTIAALLFTCLALGAVSALAAQPPIVRLRIDGVEASSAALARTGAPADDSLLAPIAEQLGLGDLAWLDRNRPAAVVLPFGGMTAGAAGMVAVLPFTGDRTSALATLGGSFDEVKLSGEIHRLIRDGRPPVSLLAGDGYFVVGASDALVRQVDARAALAPADLPPGPVAIEIELEAVAPILQLGLMQGRQIVEQQISGSEEADAVPPEMLDLYFNAARDLLANTSRIQLSFDTADGRFEFHTRVVPRGGSTLAGLAASQRGGLPDLLKLVDADGAHLLYAGQLTFTDALDAALEGYTTEYAKVIGALLPMLEQSGAETGGLDLMLELLGPEALADWQACRAGEYAGRIRLTAEMAVDMVQLSKLRDADECRTIATRFTERIGALAADELPISITSGALVHRGAQAFRIDVNAAALGGTGADGDAAPTLTQYFGFAGPVAISTMGANGGAEFKKAVDRALDGRKKKDGRVAGASDFAPLTPKAGIVLSVDLGAIAAAMPREGDEPAPAIDGRLVAGMRFVDGRVDVDVSLPLAALDAMRPETTPAVAPAATTTGSPR